MKIDIEKYKFRPYDPNFKKLFAVERRKLNKILDHTLAIEHFGSTSVPGLGGKGIIDIIILVPKKYFKSAKKRLVEDGYHYSEVGSHEERYFFDRLYKYKGKIRRVHIHLTFNGSYHFYDALTVREVLKSDPKVRREYVKLKRDASRLSKGDGKIYRDYKNPFLWKLVGGKK